MLGTEGTPLEPQTIRADPGEGFTYAYVANFYLPDGTSQAEVGHFNTANSAADFAREWAGKPLAKLVAKYPFANHDGNLDPSATLDGLLRLWSVHRVAVDTDGATDYYETTEVLISRDSNQGP